MHNQKESPSHFQEFSREIFMHFNPLDYEKIKFGKYVLHYQPMVDLQTGCIVCAEALARFQCADGTIYPPSHFIPQWEENGDIIQADFYFLELLCIKMRDWMQKGIRLPTLSINQSRLHAENASFIHNFCNIVDKYSIPHEQIIMELTETVSLAEEYTKKLSLWLKKTCIRLAIDDFGSRFAPLQPLQEVDAEIIKLDKSLLWNGYPSGSKPLLQQIIAKANQIGKLVVCEGIETQSQYEYLKQLGCPVGQGFYFAKPMSEEKFQQVVSNSSAVASWC